MCGGGGGGGGGGRKTLYIVNSAYLVFLVLVVVQSAINIMTLPSYSFDQDSSIKKRACRLSPYFL